jgi:hypothetical protein
MSLASIAQRISALAKDYERLPESHQAFVELAMIRLLLRRLAKK